jgi:hypothetical protein
MLGWLFRPTCPVDPAAKSWVEERMRWLTGEFGGELGYEFPVILPTPKFFPDEYDGSKKAARILLDRVCAYMGVVPALVALKVFADSRSLWLVNERGDYLSPGAAGRYEEGERKFIIHIAQDQLDKPMDLVGTMAHELAHVRLLGEGRTTRESYDNELLTDLTVVFRGLGIFLANVPRNWDDQYTAWPDRMLKKPDYMTPPLYGYALAHVAWFREERKPAWAKYLHPSARANLSQGLRYLWETGNSTFRPPHAGRVD